MATQGKVKEFNNLIKGHAEESGKSEKEWSDVDFNLLNKNIEKILNEK